MKNAVLLFVLAGLFFIAPPARVQAQGNAPQVTSVVYNGPVLGVGDTAIFTVSASGDPILLYQWQFNGTNLVDTAAVSGSQSNELAILNIQPSDAGNYTVLVANSSGSALSPVLALAISQAPRIKSQTINNIVNQGSPANFSVTATGTQPLFYQWLFNSAPLATQTNSTLTLPSAQPSDAGPYLVVITNSFGSVTSTVISLTVNVPPVIDAGPSDLTVNQGDDAPFSVAASGTPPLSYQWQFNGGNIDGATSPDFTVFAAQGGDAGTYTVVVTDGNGLSSSASASLAVHTPPSIDTPPFDLEVPSGSNPVFSVGASGSGPLTYQWYLNGTAITNATSATLQLTNVQTADAGTYLVVVTDTNNLSSSASAVLTVDTILPAVNLIFTTIAGTSSHGSADGQGGNARFLGPQGVAVDTNGNVFVADAQNSTIRKITPAGVVSTIAGQAGFPGWADGSGTSAQFSQPVGLALDAAGNLLVADAGNNRIRQLSAAGTNWMVATIAGSGTGGSNDGTGTAAQFSHPAGIAVGSGGAVYVTDANNNTIRLLTRSGTNWIVTTIAGLAGTPGSADGAGSSARFNYPAGIAVDDLGAIYVADNQNHTIRKLTGAETWTVSTLAGQAGSFGFADGMAATARFYSPEGIAVDGDGNVYVADAYNFTIRKITPAGDVTTLAGLAGNPGADDGAGSAARFNYPSAVAVDGAGNVFISDDYNDAIRKSTPAGVVATLAGQPGLGSADGSGSSARFAYPQGMAVDAAGNVYVADSANHTIRRLTRGSAAAPGTPVWTSSTIAGAAGIPGSLDGAGGSARFYFPGGVASDGTNLFVADTFNCTIRMLSPSGGGWTVSTIAGQTGTPGGADGTGSGAQFNHPQGVAVDGSGNLYVADTANSTIRRLKFSGGNWVVSTIGGQALVTGLADGAPSSSRFDNPYALAADASGNVFVADTYNDRLRKIFFDGSSWQTTTITLLNDNGFSTLINMPLGIAVDALDNIYAPDTFGELVFKYVPFGANWVESASAGQVDTFGFSDGTGSAALFDAPGGIALDSHGRIFLADILNNCIREGAVDVGIVSLLTSRPSLQIRVTASQALLSWPVSASGYVLQTSSSLAPDAAWTPVVSSGATQNGNYVVTNHVSPGATQAFYRLVHP